MKLSLAALSLCLSPALAADGRGLSACVLPGHTDYDFCNTSLSIDDRVKDLISKIKAEDKPNLLTARGCREDNPNCNAESNSRAPGHQQALPYLGVPAYYWGTNCIHSAQLHNCTSDGRCVTHFPSGPSLAATFDREVIQDIGGVVSDELRGAFNAKNWLDDGMNGLGLDCWSPVLNLNRDPRWGRNGEGGSEDPVLMGELGAAWTEGLQVGDDPRYIKVAVTIKHFVANSVEGPWTPSGTWSPVGTVNRHTIDVNVSKHILADYYFRPYKASIKAGARGVMCSYNSVNGEPTCLSPLLKAARDDWGFKGYVTSDSDSVADAYQQHHYSPNASAATASALSEGGCDIDSGDTYYDNIPVALAEGILEESAVDQALMNTLRVRFELGLFDPIEDQPYWKLTTDAIGTDESRTLNRHAAEASLVLLKNSDGLLPLTSGRHHVAVIGPHGNSTAALIEANVGRVCPTTDPDTRSVNYDCVTTPVEAIRALNGDSVETNFYPGATLADPNDASDISFAVEQAKEADVVVLAVGIANCGGYLGYEDYPLSSCAADTKYAHFVEAEAHDRPSLQLPPAQLELVEEIMKLEKPTVVVLINGGMVALPDSILEAQNTAVIEAFYPGKEGSVAIANAIFGASNNFGRLPYTIYTKDFIKNHDMLDHDVAVTRSTYRYLDPTETPIQFPFGFGLSYSEFKYSLASGDETITLFTNGTSTPVAVAVDIINNGPLAGDTIVQMFMEPPEQYTAHLRRKKDHHGVKNTANANEVQAPTRTLVNFARTSSIAIDETASVTFTLTAEDLLLADASGDLVSAPGSYLVTVESGNGEKASVIVELVGDVVKYESFPKAGK